MEKELSLLVVGLAQVLCRHQKFRLIRSVLVLVHYREFSSVRAS